MCNAAHCHFGLTSVPVAVCNLASVPVAVCKLASVPVAVCNLASQVYICPCTSLNTIPLRHVGNVGTAPRTLYLGTRGEWSAGRFSWSSSTGHEAGWVPQPASALRSKKDLCPCQEWNPDVPVFWRFVLPGLWCLKTGFGGWNVVLRESKGQEQDGQEI